MFCCRSGNSGFKTNGRYNCRSNTKNLYLVPPMKKEHFRRYVIVMAPFLFNQLPESIRKCCKKFEFLREVKKWLLDIQNPKILLKLII